MAGAPVLSAEWLDLVAATGASLPERAGATVRLQHDVAGGPDGPVSYVLSYVDGTFALSWKDAVKMALGEDDLLVGFMQGRVKYVGDVGKVLDLVPVTQSAAFKAHVATVAAGTAV